MLWLCKMSRWMSNLVNFHSGYLALQGNVMLLVHPCLKFNHCHYLDFTSECSNNLCMIILWQFELYRVRIRTWNNYLCRYNIYFLFQLCFLCYKAFLAHTYCSTLFTIFESATISILNFLSLRTTCWSCFLPSLLRCQREVSKNRTIL